MDVPIDRSYKNFLAKNSERIEENYKKCIEMNIFDAMIKENITIFRDNDYHSEYKWIRELEQKIESPVIFTHNDYRSDNLMVLQDEWVNWISLGPLDSSK